MIDIHTFFPHAGFAFPRGYVKSFAVRVAGIVAVTNVDNLIIGHYHVGSVETDFYWQVDPGLWLASTNGYWLNRALVATFYFNTDVMAYFPLPTNVGTWCTEDDKGFGLWVTEPDLAVADPFFVQFPPMPSDYWANTN